MYTDLKAAGIWIGLLAGLSTAFIFVYSFQYFDKEINS
jgi:hypothetical protein